MTDSDWTVLIHPEFEFRLVLPDLDHRDARGAACVLSRRCWRDGSIHYSYCLASQVFSCLLRSHPAAHAPLWFEPRNRWNFCVSRLCGRALGSSRQHRDQSLESGGTPDTTQRSPNRQAECFIGCGYRLSCKYSEPTLFRCYNLGKVANQLHLLPVRFPAESICRPCPLARGWEWWAL